MKTHNHTHTTLRNIPMKITSTLALLSIVLLLCGSAYAQDPEKTLDVSAMSKEELQKLSNKDLVNLPLEDLILVSEKLGVSVDELLNMKVSVSSKKALSPRESPGIISVIPGEEIRNSGARDLIDVLRLVPGFEFGYDVEGVTSIGLRGVWGHEGKVLIQIDGLEMNELAYSTVQAGSHFNVNNIKRIEILRGPGSCVYGGFAELAVINIITRKADDLNGLSATAEYGRMQNVTGRTGGSLEYGNIFNGGDVTLSASGSMGRRSDRDYTLAGEDAETYPAETLSFEKTFNFGESELGELKAANINLGFNYGNLATRWMYDFYQTSLYSWVIDTPSREPTWYLSPCQFYTFLGNAKYTWALSNKLTITPSATIKHQKPWRSDDPGEWWHYDVAITRSSGNVVANYDLSDNVNLLGGTDGYYEKANQTLSAFDSFANGETSISYYNLSGFAQGLLKTKYANFVAGGRADWHNEYGSAFSPRLGVTGLLNRFHYKLIFSKAFRAPGIENIRVSTIEQGKTVTPERTTVLESELGYQFTDNMITTLNIFDITIKDPIVYDQVDAVEMYANFSQTGSSGFELEHKLKYNWGYASASYSYYNVRTLEKNEVGLYETGVDDRVLLAFPAHKVTLNGSCLLNALSINPSLAWLSERFVSEAPSEGPMLLLNLNLRYRNLGVRGLGLGVGAYNILNAQYNFIQAYSGGEPPLPGPGIEFLARLTYDLNF